MKRLILRHVFLEQRRGKPARGAFEVLPLIRDMRPLGRLYIVIYESGARLIGQTLSARLNKRWGSQR